MSESAPGNRVLPFFLLAYALTWPSFLAAGAIRQGGGQTNAALTVLSEGLFLLGTFGPGLVALALTWKAEGNSSFR